MWQSIENAKEGFLCPECHHDMSNMEMLQIHFQNVHMKQPSTTGKGFFSFAKQKIKSVQDNLKKPTESTQPYAQYFLFNPHDGYAKQQYMGYVSSHNDFFKRIRKEQRDDTFKRTSQVLLQIELLTNTNEHIPPNRNTKERRKYEQGIVPWMDDSVTSVCAQCSKSFGLSRRKHHCRLDGRVICQQCTQFLSFAIARYIISSNTSSCSTTDSVTLQRLINLPSITSSAVINDKSNDDHLRLCLSCAHILQRYFNQIRYKNIAMDELFHLYEKIIQAHKEYKRLHPTYLVIIDSLLNGSTQYQIIDAQRIYRELSIHYEKIDSTSKLIVKLADNDTRSDNRYAALCRNIRTYAIQILQNFAISTRRMPSEDDVKRVRDEKQRFEDERLTKFALTIPGMNGYLLGIPVELKPFVQQYDRVTQFLQQAKLDGRQDDVRSLESNLKELEQEISMARKN